MKSRALGGKTNHKARLKAAKNPYSMVAVASS